MPPPYQIMVPQFRVVESGEVDDPWIQDPGFLGGCSGVADGWTCNNGTTMDPGRIIISPEANTAHCRTRLTSGDPIYDSPPAGPFTIFFTLDNITPGSGLRLRTDGNVLQGQFGAGQHEFTWAVGGGVEIIQFETSPGFGTWGMTWCSSVQSGP